MASHHRVLVVSPNWVGDAVMAQVLIAGLRQHHATNDVSVFIDVLSPFSCADVWRSMEGIREVMTETFQHGSLEWRKRWKWARRYKGHYDQAIVLPNSLKSALIPLLADIPRRTGYTGEYRYGVLNDRRSLNSILMPRWVDRCFALSFEQTEAIHINLPAPKLMRDAERIEKTLQVLLLKKQWQVGANIVLCPGAEFGSAKQWPLHHWVACATHLQQSGFQVWVVGGPKDRAYGESIASRVHGVRSLCGETTLGQAIDLLFVANAVVANDSGLLHVAAACGVPCVGLYGSTPSSYAPPIPQWPGQTHVLELEMDCRPCRQRVCPLKHHRCMENILPEQVEKIIQILFKNQLIQSH